MKREREREREREKEREIQDETYIFIYTNLLTHPKVRWVALPNRLVFSEVLVQVVLRVESLFHFFRICVVLLTS